MRRLRSSGRRPIEKITESTFGLLRQCLAGGVLSVWPPIIRPRLRRMRSGSNNASSTLRSPHDKHSRQWRYVDRALITSNDQGDRLWACVCVFHPHPGCGMAAWQHRRLVGGDSLRRRLPRGADLGGAYLADTPASALSRWTDAPGATMAPLRESAPEAPLHRALVMQAMRRIDALSSVGHGSPKS
jgi:hypothetical protein